MITSSDIRNCKSQDELKFFAIEAAVDFGHVLRNDDPIRGLAYLAAATMNLHLMHICIEIVSKWNCSWPDQIIYGHIGAEATPKPKPRKSKKGTKASVPLKPASMAARSARRG